MRFGISKKFLFAFVTLSLFPLVILSYYAREKVIAVGQSALDSSQQELIHNATSLLEARAQAIARQIEFFLQDRIDDLQTLARLPATPSMYSHFYRAQRRQVWIRNGAAQASRENHPVVFMYREISFVDRDGFETIRVTKNGVSSPKRDLNAPFSGPYGTEDYFRQAKDLAPGAFYVSHLLGRHVRRHEQLGDAPSVEKAIGGRSYEGIIRFAAPVYDGDHVFAGVVSLALDHRHLMEYTQHVLPIGNREVVFPSYSSGNYAFMFDDQGWIVTHPKMWDIRGYDPVTGRLIDPRSPAYNKQAMQEGVIPFNLLYVPFIHENYRKIALDVLSGKSGVTETASVAGITRVLAYAPIAFDHGEYRKTGYFGGITLGAQIDIFHQSIKDTADRIKHEINRTVRHFIIIIVIAGGIVAVISLILARHFTRPILMLTDKAKEISKGRFDFQVNVRSGDEMEILARNFEDMGRELKEKQQDLVQSLQELETSKNKLESINTRLEKQVDIHKNIHRVSHFLSINFDRQSILDTAVKTCVDGIGFERAMVYLFNENNQRLECVKTYGFSRAIEKIAYQAAYRIDRHDCIQTRVFNTAASILIEDIGREPNISELDRIIAKQSETVSFAFVPIRTADRTLGVLGADYATSRREIATEEVESLEIIANETGMALERAQLLEKTVAERDFIESIFANMLSGLVVVDRRDLIRSINPKAVQILDLEQQDAVGQPLATVLAPFPAFVDLVQQTRVQQQSTSADLELTLPGGRQVFLETTTSLLKNDSPTEDKAVLLIFRDATQRKQLEKHLNRSDRLMSLGTLAAGIAHEIRNPLTGISLLLDDLHDRMANRTEERLMMQNALEEIEKLEKIVTELLEFASKPTSHLVVKDLNKVIDHTLFFVQKQCKSQGVNLVRERNAPLPPIRLDPEKIKQAVLNILLNALNVLPEGGIIRISTHAVDNTDILNGNRSIELVIADDGPGIQPEDLNYIFDPFFTRNPNGFGLGLSITHSIVEEHNGKVVVESEPGRGAVFKLYFPVAEPDRGRP